MITPESIVVIDLDENADTPTDTLTGAPSSAPTTAERIAAHTANTWQPTRSEQEKQRDTQLGKLAELALERYLARVGVPYRSWDNLRADNFREHAPLDGFLAHPSAAERLFSERFAKAAQTRQEKAHFRPGFQQQCEQRQLFGVEVKATRVRERHLHKGVVDPERILADDFLVYPPQRHGLLTPELRTELASEASIARTIARTPYFLVRVYIERSATVSRAYLVGYATRTDFFGSPLLTVKSMPRAGKSEAAIYYALGLRQGQPMRTLTLHLQQLHRRQAAQEADPDS